MRIALAGLTVLALGLAACGGDDDEAADTTSAPVTTSVEAPSTTVVGEPTTVPDSAPDTSAPTDTGAPPATEPPTIVVIEGLDDLVLYWGYVSSLTDTGNGGTITIDVADVFFGDEAVQEGAADGVDVVSDVDPVIYVRNTTVEPQVLDFIPGLAVTLNGCDYGQGPLPGCDTATAGEVKDVPVETGQLVLFQLSSGKVARLDIPYFP